MHQQGRGYRGANGSPFCAEARRTSPYEDKRSNPYCGRPGMAERLRRPDHPATLSFNDARTFIRRLNQMEGHQRYRLPTEAEWEYAARAATTKAYSFGNDVRQLGRHAR